MFLLLLHPRMSELHFFLGDTPRLPNTNETRACCNDDQWSTAVHIAHCAIITCQFWSIKDLQTEARRAKRSDECGRGATRHGATRHKSRQSEITRDTTPERHNKVNLMNTDSFGQLARRSSRAINFSLARAMQQWQNDANSEISKFDFVPPSKKINDFA